MEIEITVKLDTIHKVKDFVSVMMTYSNSATLCSNKYTVDAKSILGIFSLDLSEPVVLKLNTEGVSGVELSDIKSKVSNFAV